MKMVQWFPWDLCHCATRCHSGECGRENQVTRLRAWHLPQSGGLGWEKVNPAEEETGDRETES